MDNFKVSLKKSSLAFEKHFKKAVLEVFKGESDIYETAKANLTGNITSPVHLALVDYVQQAVGVATPALQEGKGNGQSTTSRVTMKILIGYTGAALGKPPALYLGKWNPLTI